MRILVKAVAAVTFCALAAPVWAQSASVLNEDAGATTGLGSSHRFASANAAANHCPGDVVVWASAQGLHYVMPGAPGYGKSSGFYACKMEADDAGFSPKG